MRILTSAKAMQRQAAKWRQDGRRIGLVPTMGYLHAGHLSLIKRARRSVGADGIVVVSIYVNPTQFGPQEDFQKYPRDLQRDRALCAEAGADILFAPSDAEMYPRTDPFSTYVVEERLSRGMEGAARPTHFRGVATIVAKLLNLVLPDITVFGAKDFQQAAVIRKMICDLNFPTKIIVAPTQREPDGLALSSRNKYLSSDERRQATVLFRALKTAQDRLGKKDGSISAATLGRELKRFIEQQPAARVDYIAFFDPRSLQPVKRIVRGTHLALAVYIGRTRLIDNARLPNS